MPVTAAPSARVGEANTLWVIPELRRAWVEPLLARAVPGGGLFNLQGFVAERDLGRSVKYALRYLERHPDDCPGFATAWRRHDLYFDWLNEQQPRGGPSAGVAFAVAAYSALCQLPVLTEVAFTGALEPDGRVLGVGGLDLKIRASLAAGITTLCLPADGAPPAGAISLEVAQKLRLVALETADDAFYEAFGPSGRDVDRWDRMQTLYVELRRHMQRRERVAARVAADELVELVPNDLTAQRLQLRYASVDMTVAAQNLFADAAKFARDGLPDEALKAARRAWGYADQATREQHRDLLLRLEKGNLPTTASQRLEQAEVLVRRGDVGQAWRVLQELRAAHPHEQLLDQYQQAWALYGPVARQEESARARPQEVGARAALAQALLDAGLPWRAATEYEALQQLQPDRVDWPLAAAGALADSGKLDEATTILRAARLRWQLQTDQACVILGVEVTPPQLTFERWQIDGGQAVALVRTTDESGLPDLLATLAGQPTVELRASPARLLVDLGQLPEGEHVVRLTARDRYGNETVAEQVITSDSAAPGVCVQAGLNPPAGQSPGIYALTPGQPVTLQRGTAVKLDGGGWFGDQGALQMVLAGNLKLTTAPFGGVLATADRPVGRWNLSVVPELAPGGLQPGLTTPLELTVEPPVWLHSPAQGAALRGTVPVIVGSRQPLPGAVVRLLVDDTGIAEAPENRPLRLDPSTLAPGERALRAVVTVPGGAWLVSPTVTVTVPNEPAPAEPPTDAVVVPPTAALLSASAATLAPCLHSTERPGAIRLEPATPQWVPGDRATAAQTAIRLDQGTIPSPRRLELSLGDCVAFAAPPPATALGPEPDLFEGPFATTAWRPSQPGSYRLELADGPVMLRVTTQPAVRILDPPDGVTLKQATALRLALPETPQVGGVTLLDGDQPLGSWRRAPSVVLDPLQMSAGWHALRVVVRLEDGTRIVSPAVTVAVD